MLFIDAFLADARSTRNSLGGFLEAGREAGQQRATLILAGFGSSGRAPPRGQPPVIELG
jgi:hypothetical protein